MVSPSLAPSSSFEMLESKACVSQSSSWDTTTLFYAMVKIGC